MKLTCDYCKNKFEIKQDMLKEKYVGAMISETYFNCPKCNEKYIICIQNVKCRNLQNKIEELKEIMPETLEIEELSKELKREMDKLNGKHTKQN